MEYYRNTDDVRTSFSSCSAFVCVHDSLSVEICGGALMSNKRWRSAESTPGYVPPRFMQEVQDNVRWQALVFKLETDHDLSCARWICQSRCDELHFSAHHLIFPSIFPWPFVLRWRSEADRLGWVEWSWSAAHKTRQGEICPCVCFVACVSECVNRVGWHPVLEGSAASWDRLKYV